MINHHYTNFGDLNMIIICPMNLASIHILYVGFRLNLKLNFLFTKLYLTKNNKKLYMPGS
jgi:hypothetical protein